MEELALFADDAHPPVTVKKKKEPVKNDGTTKGVMLGVYWPLYVERYREEPLLLIKHWAQLKRLITQFGADLVTERLKLFFASDDDFIRNSGHTIGVFLSQWQKLAAAHRNTNQTLGGTVRVRCQHRPPCRSIPEHSRRMLDTLRPSELPSESFRTISKPNDPF